MVYSATVSNAQPRGGIGCLCPCSCSCSCHCTTCNCWPGQEVSLEASIGYDNAYRVGELLVISPADRIETRNFIF